jgi:2-oxo-4-hydroxy-4-carboxy--5-ureidoimidazoline (OHCU) decarboxylase
MLRTQGVPEAQIEMFINMIEKNPELFKKIAEEVQVKVKSGMSQADAGMQVMKKYEDELRKLV